MTEPADSFDDVSSVEPTHSDFHLSDYWAIVVKHRRLVLLCIAVCFGAGVLYALFSKPMYRAFVVLDIVRQEPNPLGFAGGALMGGGGGDPEFLPSQIELLRSRDVAERAVRQLDLVANSEFNPAASPKKPGEKEPSPAEFTAAALRVKANATATVVRGTSLVRVAFEASSGKLAADVANALADAFIDWNIESRFRQIGQSTQFLTTQIERAKKEIEEKEKALLAYARVKDIVILDPKTNSNTQKLEALNRDYAVAVADRVAKEARYRELQSASAEAIAEAAAGGLVAQIRGEQSSLEREYADKLSLYKPEWPAMQQLKRQVDEGHQRLQAAIQETAAKSREAARSEYLTALRRETSLQEMMKIEQSAALGYDARSGEYANLRTEIEAKRTLLDSLLKQEGEAEVLSRLREGQLTNIRVVDRALAPQRPFKPSVRKSVVPALAIGLGLGLGLAFLLSYLDRSLRSTDEVERYLQLPALGGIPLVGGATRSTAWRIARRPADEEVVNGVSTSVARSVELLPHAEPRSAIAEAYRAFRTSLLFSRAGGVRIVAVTSVLPQEGKSATAVNLAVVLAQLGRRVLLVDADLHRSRVHQLLGISNRSGLVSILAEGVEPSRVIVKTSVPGVFAVSAGPETPNPSGLLSSDAMQRFLELAATNFDHVVVDTPPVLAASDVLVFGQHTDGVVLCVRAGHTPRDQVRRVRDKLLRGGVPILGVLLNGLELDSDYYGGYEYRYLNYGEKGVRAEGSSRKTSAREAG